jgi:hypothetical protein
MTAYYVDANGGSDATGDGLSWSSAWASIGHAIGSSPAITLSGSGDVVHIRGGIYYDQVTLGLSPTSSSPLAIVGEDGLVEWAAWTNSTTKASGAALEASNQSYVTIKNVRMIGGGGSGTAGSCINVAGTWSDWTIEDCEFITGANFGRPHAVTFTTSAASAINATIRRCDFVTSSHSNTFVGLVVQSPLDASEYGLNVLLESCRFLGGSAGVRYQNVGGSGSAWSTGIRIQQCLYMCVYQGIFINSTITPTTPIDVYGSDFLCCTYGLQALASGQINEDGNYFWCNTPRVNTSAGAHSDGSSMPRFNIAIERLAGGNPRPFGEPLEGSSLIGAGNYGTPPTTDLYGQTRPSPPSIGALERDAFETPTINRIFQTEA